MGGALPEAGLVDLATESGFEQASVIDRFDCARGTSRELVARVLGVHGANMFAVKPLARAG